MRFTCSHVSGDRLESSLSDILSAVANVVVKARYCEDTVCEPVTLRIWSGDTFFMDRLGQHHERVRIANITAANVVAGCPTEVAVAQDAKLQLMSILKDSRFFWHAFQVKKIGNRPHS